MESRLVEYLQYLCKALQIIKTLICQSKPIPWLEIVGLKRLSHFKTVKHEEVEMDLVRVWLSVVLCVLPNCMYNIVSPTLRTGV